MIKISDRIRFQCARCECEFWVETNRAAAGQEVVCPNCQNKFDAAITETIGKAAKALFNVEPIGFSWWME